MAKPRSLDCCPKTTAARQRNRILISDTHAGCQMALCPPQGVPLDGGGVYKPSRLVNIVWNWWEEFWYDWVPDVCRGEPFSVIHNGDALDGRHHGSTTQISQNLADQHKMALLVLKPVVDLCEGNYYHIRGTSAHVGESAENEEVLAKALGAVPDRDGMASRNELYIRTGNALCHFTHHIGSTGSSAYESTAVYKEMVEAFVEAGRWGAEPPQVICRSHRHRQFETRVAVEKGYGISLVSPSWQLKTPFCYRLGMKQSLPQIGGYVLRQGDEEFYTRFFVKDIKRTEEA
jgi:hypothetical protein